jgi:hypothetical protein
LGIIPGEVVNSARSLKEPEKTQIIGQNIMNATKIFKIKIKISALLFLPLSVRIDVPP